MYHVLTHIKKLCIYTIYTYDFEPQDCFEILILLPSVPECRNL